jgi:hypothetical protein
MKYRVYGTFTGTKYLGEFDAESADEAIKSALDSDQNSISLCHQCSHSVSLDENFCGDGFAEEN